jgi:hypothetical protein
MSDVLIGDILPYTQAIAILGQTVYGTNWTANVASDVVVYVTPFGQSPNDQTQILSYPSQFSVAFIGDQLQVQVTLVTPSGAGDIVTITRMTPADRENLYTNTNFTPSMLNNDFEILTLVDQQAQLVNQLIAPRYNYSAVIAPNSSFPNANIILPLLLPNTVWVMNNAGTQIITTLIPSGGIAPANATYILQTANALLPNAQALSLLADGVLYNQTGTGVLTIIPQNTAVPGDVLTFVSATAPPVWEASGSQGITNWQTVTAANINIQSGDGIVANNTGSPLQIVLPTTFAVGDEIGVMGLGSAGWTLVANAGQTIKFGSVSTSVAGSISSDIQYSNLFIRGLVANTTWTVETTNSNPTYL